MNNIISAEQKLDATASEVWSAITDKDEMKQWYFDLKEFKPEVGFTFDFTGGPPGGVQYRHICVVTEAEAERKLIYSWRYEGYDGISYVTFELEPQGNATLLKLKHSGVETFPKNNPDFAAKNFELGWKEIIHNSLKNYIERY